MMRETRPTLMDSLRDLGVSYSARASKADLVAKRVELEVPRRPLEKGFPVPLTPLSSTMALGKDVTTKFQGHDVVVAEQGSCERAAEGDGPVQLGTFALNCLTNHQNNHQDRLHMGYILGQEVKEAQRLATTTHHPQHPPKTGVADSTAGQSDSTAKPASQIALVATTTTTTATAGPSPDRKHCSSRSS